MKARLSIAAVRATHFCLWGSRVPAQNISTLFSQSEDGAVYPRMNGSKISIYQHHPYYRTATPDTPITIATRIIYLASTSDDTLVTLNLPHHQRTRSGLKNLDNSSRETGHSSLSTKLAFIMCAYFGVSRYHIKKSSLILPC